MKVTETDKAILLKQRNEPAWWLSEVFGEVLWEKQVEILESVCRNRRTAVKSCHSGGKTHIAAGAVLWFLYSFVPSLVVTTAPTWRQVDKLLWGEIRTIHPKAKFALPGHPKQTPLLRINDNWYATGLSTDEPEKFQGYHSRNVLIIADEASGIADGIFSAISGCMASGNVRLLLLGNPTRPGGEFYDAFNSKRALYHPITINALETPNMAKIKDRFLELKTKQEKIELLRATPAEVEYLVNPQWVADVLEELGEDSAFWMSRVLGEFPAEAPDQLIPLHWIEAAEYRWERLTEEERWWTSQGKTEHPIELGCDIGRLGDSETVFIPRAGNIEAPMHLPGKRDTMGTAGEVIRYSREIGATIERIDADGLGIGVFDRCVEERLRGVIDFHGGKPANNSERYLNRRAEAYWALRQRYEEGNIAVPPDKKKAGQLSSIKHKTTARGQIQIESKDEMRARGLVSPDRADAEMMAFAAEPEIIGPSVW